jgi:hypothetical protein
MIEFLPEWQIQESLAANPKPLEVPGVFEGIRVRKEQRFLPSIGRYIDLLCRTRLPGGWLIVELKAEPVTSDDPILQALDYRRALAKEMAVDEEAIGCMVAAPGHPAPEPELLSRESGVLIRDLELGSLLSTGPKGGRQQLKVGWQSQHDLLAYRRKQSLTNPGSLAEVAPDEHSVQEWLRSASHDERGKEELATVLTKLSENAPLFAHEVGAIPTSLDTPQSQWFWLFYSALDRRGNAALFVKGRELLTVEGRFSPDAIARLTDEIGEPAARREIATSLSRAGIPLVVDLHYGKESLGQSVLDAARFVVEGKGFQNMMDAWRTEALVSGEDLGRLAIRKVQTAVYGMGPRSSAQFVRGMVLRGPWTLSLRDKAFLEDTKYNGLFAGPARLKIAEEDFRAEATKYADEFLHGNKGLLSHALWFIRKRYCDKVPLCGECPVAGYCAYFRRSQSVRKGAKSDSRGSNRGNRQLTLR